MCEDRFCYVIVLAGGAGARFGGDAPKQFQMLGDAPVFLHSTRKFDEMGHVSGIILVAPKEHLAYCQNMVWRHGLAKVMDIVIGGESRQESTYHGLCALKVHPDSIILVHDAARPFVAESDVAALVDAASAHTAAVLALPVTDTIKVANAGKMASKTLDRKNLYAAKTPQAARFADLMAAHEAARTDGFLATDDCQLMENIGIYPKIIITGTSNIKITTKADLEFVAFLLERGMI